MSWYDFPFTKWYPCVTCFDILLLPFPLSADDEPSTFSCKIQISYCKNRLKELFFKYRKKNHRMVDLCSKQTQNWMPLLEIYGSFRARVYISKFTSYTMVYISFQQELQRLLRLRRRREPLLFMYYSMNINKLLVWLSLQQ